MVPSRPRRRAAGGKAASPVLRALAALVAVLLAASSLGEIAHFLVVPHAICAEHGELLELSADAEHASQHHAEADAADHDAGPSLSEDAEASHDHCEILASGQKQLALPAATFVALVPAASSVALSIIEPSAACPSLPPLAVAPKTSPPPRA